MFDRKEIVTKNMKYFISYDYLRKIFESNQTKENLRYQNVNPDFQKIEPIKKMDVFNGHPMKIFHKSNHSGFGSFKNRLKNDLFDNKGYIDDGGYKKKLSKFLSYQSTDQSQSKNLCHSQNKNINKCNENKNLFNSHRTPFSMGLNKRSLQKEYSNSIKKINKRSKIKFDNKKNKDIEENKIFKSLDVQGISKRNNLIKRLTYGSIKRIKKNNLIKNENNNTINTQEIIYKRKKDYLVHNNIPFENVNENENVKNDNLKDLKELKLKKDKENIVFDKNKDNTIYLLQAHNNTGEKINRLSIEDKNKKKSRKEYNHLEFIDKIKKELKILRKNKEKNKISKKN